MPARHERRARAGRAGRRRGRAASAAATSGRARATRASGRRQRRAAGDTARPAAGSGQRPAAPDDAGLAPQRRPRRPRPSTRLGSHTASHGRCSGPWPATGRASSRPVVDEDHRQADARSWRTCRPCGRWRRAPRRCSAKTRQAAGIENFLWISISGLCDEWPRPRVRRRAPAARRSTSRVRRGPGPARGKTLSGSSDTIDLGEASPPRSRRGRARSCCGGCRR